MVTVNISFTNRYPGSRSNTRRVPAGYPRTNYANVRALISNYRCKNNIHSLVVQVNKQTVVNVISATFSVYCCVYV